MDSSQITGRHAAKPHTALFTYEKLTGDIAVRVQPEYLPRQSRPEKGLYAWAYHVTVANLGNRRVRLLKRHWIITNGTGRVDEVYGEGVIGEQPIILPQQQFSYTSGCPLQTPTGNMRGWYDCIDIDTHEPLHVRIPLFFLHSEATDLRH